MTPIFLTSQSKWNAQVRNETGGVKQKSSSYMLPLKITQAAHNEEFELGILCRDRLVTFRPRLDPENIPNSPSLSHETPPSRLQTLFDRDPDVSQKKQIPYIPAREPKLQKPLPRRHRQFVQLSNKDLPGGKLSGIVAERAKCVGVFVCLCFRVILCSYIVVLM